MRRRIAMALLAAALPAPVLAAATETAAARIPAQLDAGQREQYRAVFQALREHRWTDAQIGLAAMPPGPLHAYARAALVTAKGSPIVELEAVLQLLTSAPELPQAAELHRIARARGVEALPPLPIAQPLVWRDGAPTRARAKAVRSDAVAAQLAVAMQPLVKADDGAGAEALLTVTDGLSPEALTEWRQRVAWIYYLAGDDANARRMGAEAASGGGDWAVQGRWTAALAAWRQGDWAAAGEGFDAVAARAADADLRATALFWAARAATADGRPDRVAAKLEAAAQFPESFYGQLARQSLGIRAARPGRRSSRFPRLGGARQAAQPARGRGAGRVGRDGPRRPGGPPAGADRRPARIRRAGAPWPRR
jgi:hypothetical protein